MRILRWVLISRKEYERLRAAEKILEAYRAALKAVTEIAHEAVKLIY